MHTLKSRLARSWACLSNIPPVLLAFSMANLFKLPPLNGRSDSSSFLSVGGGAEELALAVAPQRFGCEFSAALATPVGSGLVIPTGATGFSTVTAAGSGGGFDTRAL